MRLESFIENQWVKGSGSADQLFHAVTGEKVYEISSEGVNFKGSLEYARTVGGKNLRSMTFHQRATILKTLAQYLMEQKEKFYEISKITGATKKDSWIDIEGGIGTLFAYSSIGRRDFPDEKFYIDGEMRPLSQGGNFVGRHLCVPLEGVAVQINAFNFPCWGMLEKFAPAFLAGMPTIVKPASVTAYLAESMVRSMLQSKLLPEGSLQLICGSVGDLLQHLTGQDVLSFTGSAQTGQKLRQNPSILKNSTRFNMEADSLNCCLLGPDVQPGSEEFQLFIKEVRNEMTVKAGQKCTAIRRIFVPQNRVEAVILALQEALKKVRVGDPEHQGVTMGPLVSRGQWEDVRAKVQELSRSSQLVCGGLENLEVLAANPSAGGFFPPTLLHCQRPHEVSTPHTLEAFGPVSTLMGYQHLEDALSLAKLGEGSLVGSLFTADNQVAKEVIMGLASHHGRILVVNKDCAKESTGHGSPLPYLKHGGPGRAGGGEELAGAQGVLHYMQKTALQGHPSTLSFVMNEWMPGAKTTGDLVHPFKKHFEDLKIGETLITARRTVGEADIVNFAGVSGDYFYAHMDEIAAKDSLFKKRVAHGYFVLSAAAGLFVDAPQGPVLANYGLEKLRFIEPVGIGDTIQAKLTVLKKTKKIPREGEVSCGVVGWNVQVINQHDVLVANYQILTLVKTKSSPQTQTV